MVDGTKFIKDGPEHSISESTVPAAKGRGQAQAPPEHVGT